MKLQNLIIIFLAIALPVILILSVYVQFQVDSATIKAEYNNYLVNAAHEAVLAFQINTKNNLHKGDEEASTIIDYSKLADTKIRDVEASINVFASTLATSFGRVGASKSYVMAYVPAVILSLYDGYYIYSPTQVDWDTADYRWKDIPLKHELKSYVYYSKEYKNGNKVLTINYSLDNYVAVYYYDKSQNKYISKTGYLEVPKIGNQRDLFLATLGDETSKKYYQDAWSFTEWFNEIVKSIDYDYSTGDRIDLKSVLLINENNTALPDETSKFNDEKFDVIKNSIISNIVPAMGMYGFEMPELTDSDWELIYNNVCFIAFMQDVPIGTTKYNNYVISISSENKEKTNENDIYFVNTKNEGGNEQIEGSYHRIWCPHLIANDPNLEIKGYSKTEFGINERLKLVHSCYYCMVRASNPRLSYAEEYANRPGVNIVNYKLDARKGAYYTALANEKLNLFKSSDFVNGSVELKN